MPRRRRVLVATAGEANLGELRRCLALYDVEVEAVPVEVTKDSRELRAALCRCGEDFWVKAVFREETHLVLAQEICVARPGHEQQPAALQSRLVVHQLCQEEQRLLRETGQVPLDGQAAESRIYDHSVDCRVDLSLGERNGTLTWDGALDLGGSVLRLSEVEAPGGRKVPPCVTAASRWIIETLHYPKRKCTNFIRQGFAPFERTVSFSEEDSVGSFVRQCTYLNNDVVVRCGLRNAFVSVANQGAFFRSARTRRELNYWLPGLNAGIPLTAKRDPIHEITFLAHDLGHFVLPDLVYTGVCLGSRNHRRTYVLYRMLSEAVSCVIADMLFVETLKQVGHEYDWTKRRIHPLYEATGVRPLEADTSDGFLQRLRMLLEANVDYCLKGDASTFLALVRSNDALDADPDEHGHCRASSALEAFKEKYMPFFVEDYRWTNRNFEYMEGRADQHRVWWGLVEPLATASGVNLETVEQFVAAIGVAEGDEISSPELIRRVFERVFETRVRPVFERAVPVELGSAAARRGNAFVRWAMGQCIVFARFAFVPESGVCSHRIVGLLRERLLAGGAEAIGEEDIATTRGFYSEFLSLLERRSLINADDVANFAEVCPLFEPSYAFYDESKAFYQQLADVQREIMGD